jgi:hypothetical protein
MQLMDDPLNAPVARQCWHRTKPNPWEPCRWVRWVGQRGEADGGIAAIAMALGQTYPAVRALFPDLGPTSLWRSELSRAACAALLKLYRCMITWQSAPRQGAEPGEFGGEEWPPAPFGPIHLALVRRRKESPRAHWVVLLADGTVLDPFTTETMALHSYYRVYHVGAVTRDDGTPLADPKRAPRRITRRFERPWHPRAAGDDGVPGVRRGGSLSPTRMGGYLCLFAALTAVLPQLLDLPRRTALYSSGGRVAPGTVCGTKTFYTLLKNGDNRLNSLLKTVSFNDERGEPYQTRTLVRQAGAPAWLDGRRGGAHGAEGDAPGQSPSVTVRYLRSDPTYAVVVGSDEDYQPLHNAPMVMAALIGVLGACLVAGSQQEKPARLRKPDRRTRVEATNGQAERPDASL